MSSALTISTDHTVPAGYGADALLASLPLSYQPQADPADGEADGVVVIGGSGNWPAAVAAAVRDGVRGVIVVDPAPADLSPLRGAASGAAAVVVDSPWASNPVVSPAGDAFRAAAVAGSRLECRVVVGTDRASTLGGVLLGQLSLVRALLGPAAELQVLHRSEHGYSARARVDGVAVDLSAVLTDAVAAHASARLLTGDGSVEVHIPDGRNAQPALLSLTGPHGSTLTPTHYESGHRASWRRLHHLISTGERSSDTAELDADIATASIL